MKTVIGAFNGVLQFFLLLLFSIEETVGQEATATTGNVNVSCIKKAYRYYLNNLTTANVPSLNWEIKEPLCSATGRNVHVKWVNGTNAIVVIVSKLNPSCNHPSLDRDPIKDHGPNICEAVKSPRYRRRPLNCYDFDPAESNVTCSALAINPSDYPMQLSPLAVLSMIRYLVMH